jgi:broad specificity phosphatase PhoE
MEVYIIRHGQSTNNALMDDEHLRVKDPPLTEIGWQQAEAVAEYLANGHNRDELVRFRVGTPERQQRYSFGITHLYCSAMHRALQTAKPIGEKLGLQPNVWLDIHEHGGIYLSENGVTKGYGGLTRSQILAEFPDYLLPDEITEAGWYDAKRGEETLAACYGRAILVANTLRERAWLDQHKHDRIALVTHGTFIDALIKALFNNLPSDDYYHNHYNTAITRILLQTTGESRVRYVNRIDHLPDDLITA